MAARRTARPRPRAGGTTQANAARGEYSLQLAGTTYRLRPTFEAIVAIEDTLDLTALELARAGGEGRIAAPAMGVIVAELIRAGAEEGDRLTANVTPDAIARLIYAEGLVKVGFVVTMVLSAAVTGGHEPSGEARAVAKTTTG